MARPVPTASNSTGLIEGLYTAQASQSDAAGNTGTSSANTFKIDLTDPTATITGTPADPTNATSATFTFTTDDPISGGVASGVASTECSLDGGAYVACVSGVSYSSLAEGNHTFDVRAIDNAGNTGASDSFDWDIDLTDPTATITGTPADPTNATSATFTFTTDDPISGGVASGVASTECSLDGGAYVACVSGVSYSSLAEGNHTFDVRAIDNAGNTGASDSFDWDIDLTNPDAVITFPVAAGTYNDSAFDGGCSTIGGDICGTANDPISGGVASGVASVVVAIRQNSSGNYWDGSGFISSTAVLLPATGTTTWSLAFPATNFPDEGDYTTVSIATDTVGNAHILANSFTVTFNIDRTDPDVSLVNPADGSSTNDTTPTFSGVAGILSGDLATITVKIYSGPTATGSPVETLVTSRDGTTGAYSVDSTGLIEGLYTAQASQSDAAGNTGTSSANTFKIDLTDPTATITGTPADPTNATSATFTFTTDDPISGGVASGVASTECSLDGGAYVACVSGVSYSSLAEGNHTFDVRAIDNAGNTGASDSFDWDIDLTNPDAVITFPVAAGTYNDSAFDGGCSTIGGDICGTANDPISGGVASGVASVVVAIRQNSSGNYWDGSGFISSTAVLLPATGTTTWSLAFPATNFPDEGDYTTVSIATDTVGNAHILANSFTVTFNIDRTDPDVSLVNPADGSSTNDTTPTFSGVAGILSGDLATITVKIYSGPTATGSPVETLVTSRDGTTGAYSVDSTGLIEGLYTAQASQSDAAGNTGTSSANTFKIDLTDPTATITGTPADPTNATSATFTFTTDDPISGGVASGVASTECSLDGGAYVACVSGVSYSSLAEGNHTFDVRAIDNAGNTGASDSFDWDIDLTDPTATITGTPADPTNATSATFTFTTDDPISGGVASGVASTECSLDGGAYVACVSGVSYSSLAEGNHTFDVRAIDNAGNTGASDSFDWDIDLTDPTATITGTPADPTNATSATFTFTTDDPISGGVASGVASTECSLDGGAYVACVSGVSYSSLAEGNHTFDVRAIDNAGNTGASDSFDWDIDLTDPTGTIAINANATYTNSTSVTLNLNATDTNGIVNYRVAQASDCSTATYGTAFSAVSPYAANVGFTLTGPDGTKTVCVQYLDAAGNVSLNATDSIILDLTDPTGTIAINANATYTNSTSVTLNLNATDTNGIVNYRVAQASDCSTATYGTAFSAVSPYAANVGFTLTGPDGTKTVCVQYLDAAGNVSLQCHRLDHPRPDRPDRHDRDQCQRDLHQLDLGHAQPERDRHERHRQLSRRPGERLLDRDLRHRVQRGQPVRRQCRLHPDRAGRHQDRLRPIPRCRRQRVTQCHRLDRPRPDQPDQCHHIPARSGNVQRGFLERRLLNRPRWRHVRHGRRRRQWARQRHDLAQAKRWLVFRLHEQCVRELAAIEDIHHWSFVDPGPGLLEVQSCDELRVEVDRHRQRIQRDHAHGDLQHQRDRYRLPVPDR